MRHVCVCRRLSSFPLIQVCWEIFPWVSEYVFCSKYSTIYECLMQRAGLLITGSLVPTLGRVLSLILHHFPLRLTQFSLNNVQEGDLKQHHYVSFSV